MNQIKKTHVFVLGLLASGLSFASTKVDCDPASQGVKDELGSVMYPYLLGANGAVDDLISQFEKKGKSSCKCVVSDKPVSRQSRLVYSISCD
jgi:hypothetical protein